jgi:hypothetical protein
MRRDRPSHATVSAVASSRAAARPSAASAAFGALRVREGRGGYRSFRSRATLPLQPPPADDPVPVPPVREHRILIPIETPNGNLAGLKLNDCTRSTGRVFPRPDGLLAHCSVRGAGGRIGTVVPGNAAKGSTAFRRAARSMCEVSNRRSLRRRVSGEPIRPPSGPSSGERLQ